MPWSMAAVLAAFVLGLGTFWMLSRLHRRTMEALPASDDHPELTQFWAEFRIPSEDRIRDKVQLWEAEHRVLPPDTLWDHNIDSCSVCKTAPIREKYGKEARHLLRQLNPTLPTLEALNAALAQYGMRVKPVPIYSPRHRLPVGFDYQFPEGATGEGLRFLENVAKAGPLGFLPYRHETEVCRACGGRKDTLDGRLCTTCLERRRHNYDF